MPASKHFPIYDISIDMTQIQLKKLKARQEKLQLQSRQGKTLLENILKL